MKKVDKRTFKVSALHGPITQTFLDEVERYQLRFLCEDCAFFDSDSELCAHGYPNQAHSKEYFENSLGKVLIFCREFEMDEGTS